MRTTGPGGGIWHAAFRLLLGVLILGGAARLGAQEPDDRARRRILELRTEIARHDELYFKQAAPEITDAEYDRLKRELRALEAAHPGWAAPADGIGDDRSGSLPTQRHGQPMLSLAKVHTEAEWREFHARLAERLGRTDLAFVIEPKYDGLAISLTYEQDALVRALTRGNGTEGDDVAASVRRIAGLPGRLRGPGLPARVELRGEVYLELAEFARINAARLAAGQEPFAHPRNLAVGTLRSAGPGEAPAPRLSLVIFGWGAWEGTEAPATQQAFHALVSAWGLPAVAGFDEAHTAEAVWAAVEAFGRRRGRLAFPADGAVVKLADTALRDRLGADGTAPRWAVACKFAPERAVTRVRAITIQVGRTGVLTPVAELEPVELGGATVTRVTLHNRAEIARRDVRVGDFVEVEKAGEIIPALVGVQIARRPADTPAYEFPSHCPACGTAVTGGPAVRCPNRGCPAQRQRRLEHFASAQAVDIPGLGPALVAALIRADLVGGPADFYRLRRADLLQLEGVGEKTADRLLAGIEHSKEGELWRFVHGLGIPEVGEETSRKLAALAGDLAGLARLEEARLGGAVGPAVATAVADFLARPENQADIRALIAAGVRPGAAAGARGAELHGMVFVFTGTLPGLTRARAAELVRAAGGSVRDSVSRQTDYLVAGEDAGAKLAEARRLGVKVISAEEFRRLVGME